MQNFPRRWDILTTINYLQRKIIISSILYYEYNQSPISDKEYDELSKQLIALTNDCKENDKSQYWYCFYDFDGNTGFDIPSRLNDKDKEYLYHLADLFGGGKETNKSRKSIKKGKLF